MEEEKSTPKPKSVIRTFSKDLADKIKEKGGEAFNLARKEETAKEEGLKLSDKRLKLNKVFIILSFVFILTSLIVLAVPKKEKVDLFLPINQDQPIIFFNQESPIDITDLSKDKILNATQKELSKSVQTGDVISLQFIQKNAQGDVKVSLNNLFTLLKITPPINLSSLLENKFMYGVFGGETNQPFLILKNKSYPNAVSGMLEWEDHLPDDLLSLLNTSSSEENEELAKLSFQDEIVKNKPARVLRNNSGKIVILYLFLNEETILITKDPKTVEEVLLRLYLPKK